MNALVSEHPIAAVCVAVFAIVQGVTFALLLRSAFLLLKQLRRILALAPNNAATIKCESLPFITWCRQPATSPFLTDGQQRREMALAEVDQWFAELPTYQLLQRSGYTAPLLGVLITAFGFLGAKSLGSSETVDQLLGTVSPLVLGIAGGAFLAILSQVFLFSADIVLARVRRLADKCYAHLAAPADQCPGVQAFVDLAEVTRTLHALFSSVPPQLAVLVKAASSTDRTLAAAGKKIEDMAGSFATTVTAFREIVGTELKPALEAHASTVGSTNDIATLCFESLREFKAAASSIEQAGARLLETTDGYAHALDEVVMPSNRQLADTAKKVGAIATNLGKPLEAFLAATSAFNQAMSESAGSLQQFGKMADAFGDGVRTHFLPAAEGHRLAIGNIEAVSGSLRAANEMFNKSLLLVAKTVQAHRDIGEQLVELVQEKSVPAHDMLASCVKRFDEFTADLSQCTDGYTAAVLNHATEVTRLSKQVDALAQRLEDAVQRTTDVATNMLSSAVAQATHSGDKLMAEGVFQAITDLRGCIDAMTQMQKEQRERNDGISRLLEAATSTNRQLLAAITRVGAGMHDGEEGQGLAIDGGSVLPKDDQSRSFDTRAEGTTRGIGGLASLWQRRR